MVIDNPVNYFFTFDEVKWADPKSSVVSHYAANLAAAGVTDLVKLVTIPLGANKIRVRLENTGDYMIDGAQNATVNLEAVMIALLIENNIGPASGDMHFVEKSLTGNMDIDEMLKRKIQWKTMDKPRGPKLDRGQDITAIKLELQRIRVFDVTVNAMEN